MNYLNLDHIFFEENKSLRSDAIRQLYVCAYQCSHSFRLQFDSWRLERVMGSELFSQLMPNFPLDKTTEKTWKYDIYEDILIGEKTEILRRILEFNPTGFSERPLNYIKSVRLLDKEGGTVLRGGDHNTFILFKLPKLENDMLLEKYRQQHIPEEVIEHVDVDVEELDP